MRPPQKPQTSQLRTSASGFVQLDISTIEAEYYLSQELLPDAGQMFCRHFWSE